MAGPHCVMCDVLGGDVEWRAGLWVALLWCCDAHLSKCCLSGHPCLAGRLSYACMHGTVHTQQDSPVPPALAPSYQAATPPPPLPPLLQAADINALFGFRLECLERLGDEEGIYVWKRINQLFNWLPLAANIENKILCMHGGIGRCIHKIDQIAQLKRPITMEEGGPVLMDLLWSDPTTNDAVVGVQPSPRGPGLVTFGPDRVKEFCKVGGRGWLTGSCWLRWPVICAAAVCPPAA